MADLVDLTKKLIASSNSDESDNQKIVVDFFASHKTVKDSDVHSLAEKLGIDKHKFEEIIYKLLSDFFSGGKSKGKSDADYDADKLAEGIKVEMEHSNNKYIAAKIAKDHLEESNEYYTDLKKIEKAEH